uniref:Uncharacterized protein n=1 Tax=Pipistrellus kuhlii TaxID=59472 RepID=A0A7J7YMN2_PIPKU|nr:hypothetical protein mPipKuh1_010067 [Pipistrellus kuhlii]
MGRIMSIERLWLIISICKCYEKGTLFTSEHLMLCSFVLPSAVPPVPLFSTIIETPSLVLNLHCIIFLPFPPPAESSSQMQSHETCLAITKSFILSSSSPPSLSSPHPNCLHHEILIPPIYCNGFCIVFLFVLFFSFIQKRS